MIVYIVFDAVQSPVNLEESWSLKKNSKNLYKKFIQKIILLTYWELDLLILCFFLFKYDVVIIKQPSSCSFGKKL